MIDTHCHILPGMDDGAGDEAQALEMARVAAADGITGIIVTPHYIPGLYTPAPALIRQQTENFQSSLDHEGIQLELHPGSEVAIDSDLPSRYLEGELVTLADKGLHLLVELPAGEIPAYTGDVLYRLQLAGITPIIAHPERNYAVLRDPEWVGEMVERGILIQVTAASITGVFGRKVKELALALVRQGQVSFVATDAHSTGRRGPRLSQARREVSDLLSPAAMEWLFQTNPQHLLQGEPIPPFIGEAWLKPSKAPGWLKKWTMGI